MPFRPELLDKQNHHVFLLHAYLRESPNTTARRIAMFTRRDLLKVGLVSGAYSLLGPASRRRVFADELLAASPKTTPFVVELPIAPIKQSVAAFPTQADPANCVNVDGTTAFHVHGPRAVPTNTQ